MRAFNRVTQIFRDEKRPIKFLVSRVLCRSGLCRALMIQRPGYRLRFHPTCLSAELWVYRSRMSDEQFLARYLKAGDVVVDIGANIGTHSLKAASMIGATGRVIAFEAHPKTFCYLRQNVQLNGFVNIQLHHSALGDRTGTVNFSDKSADDQNHVVETGGIEVPVKILDESLNVDHVDLLKIDVEGYERFVLEGARQVLSRTQCVMYESWDRHCEKFGYRAQDLNKLFRDLGFGVYRLAGEQLVAVPGEHGSAECENLIAIRDPDHFLQRTGYRLLQ